MSPDTYFRIGIVLGAVGYALAIAALLWETRR